jgi:DNA-binding MarR family transcriptional regulator
MARTARIAQEISILMPVIARRVLLSLFQSIEIPQTQLFTIITLFEQQPCRLSALSRQLRISAPTTSGIVDRLERGGYAKRLADKSDRRAVSVVLTVKGRRIAKTFRETVQTRWRELLRSLSSEDQENYLRLLKKIRESVA